MGRHAGLQLSRMEQRELRGFMGKTKNKHEFRAVQGMLLRSEGKSADDVATHFGVTTLV